MNQANNLVLTNDEINTKYAPHKPFKMKGVCMNGSIFYQSDRKRYAVNFYYQGKSHKIYRYKGELIYDRRVAEKCLALIQGRYEQYQQGLCTFRIEEFTGKGFTDVLEFFEGWMKDVIEPARKPATIKGYWSYYRNWIKPFFTENNVMLHEIQLDTLIKLKNFTKLNPKGRYNVLNCFHRLMVYAKRTSRIPALPSFPEKYEYGLKEPEIKYLLQDQQEKVFEAIPEEVRPIFLFLKYHYRRPSEACALQWCDYDEINNAFTIQRSFSARELVESTKTNAIHYIPCHDYFYPVLKELKKIHDADAKGKGTDFIFQNPRGKGKSGKHFTNNVLGTIWRAACKKANIHGVNLYQGTKHTACMFYVNEVGSIDDLQVLTDHKRRDSLKHYAFVGLDRKRHLMMKTGKIISLENWKTTPKLPQG